MAVREKRAGQRSGHELHTLVFVEKFLKFVGGRCRYVVPVAHVRL